MPEGINIAFASAALDENPTWTRIDAEGTGPAVSGKALKADASAADAYATLNFADTSDVWVTFDLAFDAAALTYWTTTASGILASLFSSGPNIECGPFIDLANFVLGFAWSDAGAATFTGGNVPAPVSGVWQTPCELHHDAGTGLVEFYIGGALVYTDSGSTALNDELRMGQYSTWGADPAAVAYFRNVKVGTTRGGSEVFADDFSSGDLSAWSSTTGAVSVVDDPYAEPSTTGYRLVTGYSIRRGNDAELDKAATGTATLKCRDLNGQLDPTNPLSPFSGQLVQQKPALIMVQHPFTLAWHSLFRGFVDRYTHDLDMWTDERGIDHCQIELYDGFGFMSRLELMPTVHGEPVSITDFPDIYYPGTPSNLADEADVFVHVDDRIMKLLDDAGWPNTGEKREGLRDIFSGNVSVQGSVVDRGDGLMGALGDAVDAEFPGGANHYMDKTGVYKFRGRFAFIFPENPGYGINFWNVGTATIARADPTVAAISGLEFADGEILNSVGAWPQGVTDADVPGNLVEDSASIAEFGRSGATFPDLITSAGHTDLVDTNAVEETRKFADFYVGNRKDPRTVVSRISFVGRTDDVLGPAIWDLICGVEIGDVISLTTTHPGGGGFDEELFVDSIEHERPSEVHATHELHLGVSPRPTYNPFGDIDTGNS